LPDLAGPFQLIAELRGREKCAELAFPCVHEIRTIEPEYVDGGLPFGCATCDHAFVIKYEVFVRIIRTRIDE
jgi:hypothetical protein